MTPRYSLDTSFFVNSWRRYYQPDVFPGVWERLAGLIDAGAVIATEEVRYEIEKQEDEILQWVNQRPELFVPTDGSVQWAVREILRGHPRIIDTRRSRSGADPFVIAVAQTANCAVVTDERATNSPDRPHIPDVCAALSVRCIEIVDLFRAEGWQLR